MAKHRKPTIPQRKRLFIGCEGLSEVGYIQWLRVLSNANGGYIHVISENLNGGSLVQMVNKAEIAFKRHQKLAPIKNKYILIDSDRGENDPIELREAMRLINEYGFNVIWQSPNHEGFLLTHCEKFTGRIPTNNGDASRLLLRQKTKYLKPMPMQKYKQMFNDESPKIAAEHNDELAKLLKEIKVIEQ